MSKTLKVVLIVGIALMLGGGLLYGAAYALNENFEPSELVETHFREIGLGGLFYGAAYVSDEKNERADTTEATTVINEVYTAN